MEEEYQELLSHRGNVTSQWGEDGLIEEIFQRIGTESRSCVEFGAFDGKHLSNTWNLWHEHDWKALLIESDPERAAILVREAAGKENVWTLQAKVSSAGENSLDAILSRMGFPRCPDLLSIDIDSDDYHIFEGMKEVRPRLLIIEYNPTVPPHLNVVQVEGEYFGASALAMNRMALTKGYVLACMTNTNCFFLRKDVFPAMGMPAPELKDIFPGTELTYLITSQAGHTYLSRQPVYAPKFGRENWFNLGKSKRSKHPRLTGEASLMPVRVFES